MGRLTAATSPETTAGPDPLFLHRTIQILWIGIGSIFFYSLLDLIVHPTLWSRFFVYRLATSAFLLVCLGLLHFRPWRRNIHVLLLAGLTATSCAISLMCSDLGGFVSSYYLGIALVAAFVFSFLPVASIEILLAGSLMFLVYVVVILFQGDSRPSWVYLLNNGCFYFAILAATTVKSRQDSRMRQALNRQRARITRLKTELEIFTDDLDVLVERRLKQIRELELRYQELYENIQDMLVVVDRSGLIIEYNKQFQRCFLGSDHQRAATSLTDYLIRAMSPGQIGSLKGHLSSLSPIDGMEVVMLDSRRRQRIIEINGTPIKMGHQDTGMQLVLRDISDYRQMEHQVLASSQLIDHSRQVAILGLAKLAEYRDQDTGDHLERIRAYTEVLARQLMDHPRYGQRIDTSFIDDIAMSSILHDIGKVGIPDEILLKPGKLTKAEFELMKQHTIYGRDALRKAARESGQQSFLAMGQEIALSHHEKWDGSGYPQGLRGEEIPLPARIVALADVYDALTSRRSYKKPFSHEQAREIIVAERGRHFDPAIVDAFLVREESFKRIRIQILRG